jgi:anti-sigma factor RsiW
MANEEMLGFDPEVVHRYFDGELSPEELDAAEEVLARSEEARALLAGMARGRTLLRSAADTWEAQLSAEESDDLFARITAAIERDEPAPGAPEAEPARPRPALTVIAGGRAKVFAGLGALGVALAAAAAVALAVVGGPGVPPVTPGRGVAVGRVLGSEVIAADFGRNTGTLFNVEGQAGQPLAVVWISDQVEKP